MRNTKHLLITTLAVLSLVLVAPAKAQHLIAPETSEVPPEVEVEEVHVRDRLQVLSSVTWWSLDANGYHPAILVKIQNASGHDLTGRQLQFQARFIDSRSGMVTVGRSEARQSFPKNKLIYILLKGKDAYELSKDVNEWPAFECKLMCRVGNVGDEATQTLWLSKIELVAMTDEDAFYKINRMADLQPYQQPVNAKEEEVLVKRGSMPVTKRANGNNKGKPAVKAKKKK